jgi:hypothetical protein
MSILAEVYGFRWYLVAIGFVTFLSFKFAAYKRLAAFQGPFSVGWSELWHTRTMLSMRSHLVYKDVNDKYGKSRLTFILDHIQHNYRNKTTNHTSRCHRPHRTQRLDHILSRVTRLHERRTLPLHPLNMV